MQTNESNKLFDTAYKIFRRYDIVPLSKGDRIDVDPNDGPEVLTNWQNTAKYVAGATILINGSFISLGAVVIASVRVGDYVVARTQSPMFAMAAFALTLSLGVPAFAIATRQVAKIAKRFGFE